MSGWGALLAVLVLGADVRLEPGSARPGDVVLIEVTGATQAPQGSLGDTELTFLPLGASWVALVGFPVEAKPKALALELRVQTEGGVEELGGTVELGPNDFRRRQLTVSKRFTSPSKKDKQRAAADQKAFSAAMDRDFEPWNFSGSFEWPRVAEITAPFGDLRLLNNKTKSQHFGLDLDGRTGDPIVASNAGEVVLVRDCFASGNTVLVHHGGRLFTSYFHLTTFAVKEGERVTRGQLLGTVGKTGRVTGPHLHFGVKLDGRWVDPESLLSLTWPVPASTPDAGAP